MKTITYHPTAKRAHGGYVPMVTIRMPNGTLRGSYCGSQRFDHPADAAAEALFLALHAANKCGARVADRVPMLSA